jgi:hypothetical protein
MRKLFTYIVISLYLLGSTEAYQLLKIGYLVEHYFEHKDANDLSLVEFIDVHYIQPSVVDADYAEDMKLPFKSHKDCQAQIIQFAKLPTNDFFIDVPYIETNTEISAYNSPFTGTQYLDEIFQPPRSCARVLVC